MVLLLIFTSLLICSLPSLRPFQSLRYGDECLCWCGCGVARDYCVFIFSTTKAAKPHHILQICPHLCFHSSLTQVPPLLLLIKHTARIVKFTSSDQSLTSHTRCITARIGHAHSHPDLMLIVRPRELSLTPALHSSPHRSVTVKSVFIKC